MNTKNFAAAALCASLAPAAAAPPFLDEVAYQYGQCVPAYHQTDLVVYDGAGSYQIDVKDKLYTIALQERMSFSLRAGIGGPVVAEIKLECPSAAQFQEQSLWRERSLRDVAERSGVALEERTLAGGVRLLIINKSEITGNYVGRSLMIDLQRQLFVDTAWPNKLPGYRGPGGIALVRRVQDDLWQRMQSCLPATRPESGLPDA